MFTCSKCLCLSSVHPQKEASVGLLVDARHHGQLEAAHRRCLRLFARQTMTGRSIGTLSRVAGYHLVPEKGHMSIVRKRATKKRPSISAVVSEVSLFWCFKCVTVCLRVFGRSHSTKNYITIFLIRRKEEETNSERIAAPKIKL